ncbi:MAG: MotA/TolQ/ExbB proton channel family protein [Gammaproteobacteria bacterium]|jgi:biopolymer transport protein ExbB|nr:MotA/TolQ/ExbB proton channel family protein [Gammaproteobacteria bacterium]MBT5217041.1 MotA/TolQ/ExbB proton channel family protein [Gammaproteobacteria bacterium]MBT5542054.1 MotA/TolQ/ExbB proton channel family protein [Gammaproteobacteria bacterium]MBT6074114.1 MotA/TolQ/ExbB proton channel family protein [Gammaproteobacteria bacterium]MBT7754394.1 MotA/TolQ/ExbB proton channel family protein [Gammaproteobacteria bacterium]
MNETFIAVRDFLEMGGQVLNVIAVVIFLMWMLILERIAYFQSELKTLKTAIQAKWNARSDKKSWASEALREKLISEFNMSANQYLPIIKTLVALCPLLGLMGTVTGMIEVFDVMAVSGSGNARSMASGVSKATIPTMAGMVGALSGVFLATLLTQKVTTEVDNLEEQLSQDD